MSFTAFNAPIQQKPKPAQTANIDGSLSLAQRAFSDRPDLVKRLHAIAYQDASFVNDLSTYVLSLKQLQSAPSELVSGPTSKKRKLEDGGATNGSSSAGWADQSVRADHAVPDISFSIPQRKKLRLEWVGSSSSDLSKGGIRAADAAGNIEFGVSWKDIDQIFSLPVPEKTKRQHNFVIIPSGAHGLGSTTPGSSEPIIWTVFEPSAKELHAGAIEEPANMAKLLNKQLAPFGKKVVFPDENEFASAIVQSHRKEEKAFHAKAHRGAKDGYLFLLPPGILWCFKKPLLFLPFSSITSISYTSVLQRTFNLNVSASVGEEEDKEEEIEFSMLDQADFAGIDEYVKRHGLNDASLAAGRRAKKYGVNDPKAKEKAAANGNGNAVPAQAGEDEEDENGETELEKAERMLQDEEDEMEEDYVEEEGDDDGSGSSGDEEVEEEYEGGEGGEDGAEVFEEEQEFEGEEGGYEDEG